MSFRQGGTLLKFVIAPDSFKGSLTAKEVGLAIQKGLTKIYPESKVELVPMADGGEGTVQALTDATKGNFIQERVTDPLGRQVLASYGILGNSNTAVIEMAAASGLQFVDENTRDPLKTTTYGTGQLILSALNHGVKKIILGLGGSATNDGGAGMAQALGAKLLAANGAELAFGGGALDQLDKIDIQGVDSRIKDTQILIASDVTNPLTGKNGASAIFGPQKGATPAMITQLDQNLAHYADMIARDLGLKLKDVPGGGAAGGLGAGLLAFTNAKMERGIDIVVEYSELKKRAQDADFVLTGEGGIDYQTKFGKTPYGVALATKSVAPTAPVIVLAGNVGDDIESLYHADSIDAVFSTPSGAKSLEQAIADSAHDIKQVAENIARLIKTISEK